MIDDYVSAEYIRLLNKSNPKPELSRLGLVSYAAQCSGDAMEVVSKATEVLLIIDTTLLHRVDFPTPEEWGFLLPKWFISKFKDERTEEEAKKYLEWWDSLTYQEKLEQSNLSQSWSLGNWITYFDSEQREWYWWSSYAVNTDKLLISLEVKGFPFPSGAFLWLLESSGAKEIEEIDVCD